MLAGIKNPPRLKPAGERQLAEKQVIARPVRDAMLVRRLLLAEEEDEEAGDEGGNDTWMD